MINNFNKIFILVIACILDFLSNYKYDQCFNKLKGKKNILLFINIIIHSIIVGILFTGWIFDNKTFLKCYILLLVLVIAQWILLENNQFFYEKSTGCIITVWKNMLCNEKLDTRYKGIAYGFKMLYDEKSDSKFKEIRYGSNMSGMNIYSLFITFGIIAFIKINNQ